MIVHIKDIKMMPLAELRPHPKNPNKHSEAQIKRLAKVLEYQGWRYPIKVSNRSGFITSGHGRLLAAKYLGLDSVPVSYQDYADDDAEYADIVSDNAIASWADLDYSAINSELANFDPSFDIDLLGIEHFKLDAGENVQGDGTEYTGKIDIPIYEPKRTAPPHLSEVIDESKFLELAREIKSSSLPEEEKCFLLQAASRHIVFNYEEIAELYCHSTPEMKLLMEKSALVIIDFDRAIEYGLVKLTKDVAKLYDQQ